MLVITGPNMGGKNRLIWDRQRLIVILGLYGQLCPSWIGPLLRPIDQIFYAALVQGHDLASGPFTLWSNEWRRRNILNNCDMQESLVINGIRVVGGYQPTFDGLAAGPGATAEAAGAGIWRVSLFATH